MGWFFILGTAWRLAGSRLFKSFRQSLNHFCQLVESARLVQNDLVERIKVVLKMHQRGFQIRQPR